MAQQTQGIVTLYEDGAGHLFIAVDGALMGYDVTDVLGRADFREDAAALLAGDTEEWPVDQVQVAALGGRPQIAEYDGADVRLLFDRVGGAMPGRAATRYLGPDAPEE